MTNDEIRAFLNVLRGRGSNPATIQAADLIEKLQRERDEARDRLAEAQSDAEKWCKDSILMLGFADILEEHGLMPSSSELISARDRALAKSREQGFRAGIEAAAEKARIHMLGMSRERSDKMQKAILALSPSDKPAAPSVADHDIIELRGIGNYYGTLCLKRENGQDYWTIENYDGHDWAKIPDELGSALRALAAREGE